MEIIKKHLRNFLKKHHRMRILVRKVYSRYKEKKYRRIASKIPVDEKMVLFETFMGRQYGCNPKAIYEYMISDSRFDGYNLVWALIAPEKAKDYDALNRAEIV